MVVFNFLDLLAFSNSKSTAQSLYPSTNAASAVRPSPPNTRSLSSSSYNALTKSLLSSRVLGSTVTSG